MAKILEMKRHDVKFKIVESPYYTLNDKDSRDFFSEVMAFKVHSYRQNYPDGVFPFNAVDFIAHHVGIYLNDKLVITYKIVSYDDTEFFNLKMPLMECLEDTHNPKWLKEQIVNELNTIRGGAWYIGSLSKSPDANREQGRLALDAFIASLINLFREFNMHTLFCTRIDKIEKLVARIGFSTIYPEPLYIPDMVGCSAFLAKMTDANPESENLVQMFKREWEDRVVYTTSDKDVKKAA